jgi:NtrC-family two-component system sensor histidine kinase KinB
MARTPVRTPAEGAPTAPVQVHAADAPVVTTAKGTRENIADQAAQAQEEVSQKAEVLSLVHDVRTPLAIIMLESQLLERRLGFRASPEVRSGLARIVHNAAYIERLVSELLDLSSAEGDRLELRCERVDLARLIAQTLDRAVSSADRPRVSVEIRDVLYVDADPVRIERVIANLIGNALKFSPDSVITIGLDSHDELACIEVIDSGPGLTPDEASRVFDRYQRTEQGRAHEGYGLGLYICRRIIDAHGGRIGVTSTPGKGSRFFFELLALTE